MSRMKSIAVPLAALLAAVVVAGCGGSPDDEATTAASTQATTTPVTTTPATTSTQATTTTSKTTTEPTNISEADTNTGGRTVGRTATLNAANGGVLTVDVTKVYKNVESVSDFDPAPSGSHYVGVKVEARYKGNQEGVTSSTSFEGDDGSQLPSALLADPDCGRNLINLSLLGVDLGKKGCLVGLAPKGVNLKSVTVILRSGKDSSQKATAKVPL